MLQAVGASSLDALIDEAIPADIRLTEPLRLPDAETEFDYLKRLKRIAGRNRLFRSFIGMGYYGCVTPSVIQRNVLEHPGLVHAVHAVSGRNRPRPAPKRC